MTSLTETLHAGEFILMEGDGHLSREAVTVLTGQVLKSGHVVGKITANTTVAAPTFAGTGNGGITMDATHPTQPNVQVGTYTATMVAVVANGGVWSVVDPSGKAIGTAYTAQTFSDQIKFVIADGATDYVLGDKYSIVVTAGSGKIVEYNPANFDGSDRPYGILYKATDATSADKPAVAIVRAAEVDSGDLTWFSGATGTQKTTAQALMAAANLIVR